MMTYQHHNSGTVVCAFCSYSDHIKTPTIPFSGLVVSLWCLYLCKVETIFKLFVGQCLHGFISTVIVIGDWWFGHPIAEAGWLCSFFTFPYVDTIKIPTRPAGWFQSWILKKVRCGKQRAFFGCAFNLYFSFLVNRGGLNTLIPHVEGTGSRVGH